MIESHFTDHPLDLLVDPDRLGPGLANALVDLQPVVAALARIERSLTALEARVDAFQGAWSESLVDVHDALDIVCPGPADVVELRTEISAAIGPMLASGSIALVVGKGANYLRAPRLRVWNFPCGVDGRYRGYYPGDDLAATAHLEALRAKGARYLVIPSPSQWWLVQYPQLGAHLRSRFHLLHDDGAVTVFDLQGAPPRSEGLATLVERVRNEVGHDPAVLDLTGRGLAAELPGERVFAPPQQTRPLAYLDRSIDVVVVPAGDRGLVVEAERVASVAVIKVVDEPPGAAWALVWSGPRANAERPRVRVVLMAGDGAPAVDEHRQREVRADVTALGADLVVATPEDHEPLLGIGFPAAATILERLKPVADEDPEAILVVVAPGVVPLPGSLVALVRALGRTGAAIACGRVVDSDGSLLSAGGTRDGQGPTCWTGAGDPRPDSEDYSYARLVDAVPEELFAVRAGLLSMLDGPGTGSRQLDALVDAASERGDGSLYEPDCVAVVAQPAGRLSW